ncbi:hypothetical protein DL93DRAFT_2088744 [Clavulina sp. PMI_390]|nr:hypothetical protein DL93DRAFT_2088744 [Clavulina sp. PMI_390]
MSQCLRRLTQMNMSFRSLMGFSPHARKVLNLSKARRYLGLLLPTNASIVHNVNTRVHIHASLLRCRHASFSSRATIFGLENIDRLFLVQTVHLVWSLYAVMLELFVD